MEKTISSKITFVLITSDDTSRWWNYLDEEAFWADFEGALRPLARVPCFRGARKSLAREPVCERRNGAIVDTKSSMDRWARPAYWPTCDTDEKLLLFIGLSKQIAFKIRDMFSCQPQHINRSQREYEVTYSPVPLTQNIFVSTHHSWNDWTIKLVS
jgi:hypothetical protein